MYLHRQFGSEFAMKVGSDNTIVIKGASWKIVSMMR